LIIDGPRSTAEERVIHDENENSKYRQLPCRTFISVGTCPYRERCVYLHDPRILCRDSKTKTRKRNKEDDTVDSLFWPIMTQENSHFRLDNHGKPRVIQQYHVPPPQSNDYKAHDEAVYSLWNNFVEFCQWNSNHNYDNDNTGYLSSNVIANKYTNKKRLNTFLLLSNGKSIKQLSTNKSTKSISSPISVCRPLSKSNSFDSHEYVLKHDDSELIEEYNNRLIDLQKYTNLIKQSNHPIVMSSHTPIYGY